MALASQATPAGSDPKEWRQLLEETLGKWEGAAVAESLARREVVINVNVTGCSEDQASGQGSKKTDIDTQKPGALGEPPVVFYTEEPAASVLHVVAAVGDRKHHLECARKIHTKERHLLTTASDSTRDTPLHCAARAGNTKMVACLIHLAKGGVDGVDHRDLVRMQNKRGETALHVAISTGNVEMVQELMSADKEFLAKINAQDGTSPLYLACSLGHGRIARMILEEDKEPSYSGPRGQNALHVAALQNDLDTAALLLEWNKNLAKERDWDGSTPSHCAASAPDPFFHFTFNVFSAGNFERFSLGSCCFGVFVLPIFTTPFERRKLLQLLDANPVSAFQLDNKGSFPVHIAAAADSTVSLLILYTHYPRCVILRNADGQTFLHVAIQEKRLGVVRFAMHYMFRHQHRALAMSVLNVQDKNGDTALHLAVEAGDLNMCRLLIANQHTQINLRNMKGKTPLDIAAGRVKSGFYFGLGAPRRILSMLNFADARSGSNRRDKMEEYNPHPPLDEEAESAKIKDFAQIVGIGSVLVSTATFAAAITVPGGVWSPGDSVSKRFIAAPPPAAAQLIGTPVLTGSYVFDGFVISNTLAFICSTLATFSLVYCGVAAVDIQKRFRLVEFSLVLLLCSARSFCAAFTFALYMLLAKVAYGTAMAACILTSLALLDGVMFLRSSLNDMIAVVRRNKLKKSLRYGPAFLFFNIIYPFWPYLVIGGYFGYDYLSRGWRFHNIRSRHY